MMCNKRRFKDEAEALMVLNFCQAHLGSKGMRNRRHEKRAYFCKYCKAWHLTSHDKIKCISKK